MNAEPLTPEGAEVLASDLAHLDPGQYRIVAEWMLERGLHDRMEPGRALLRQGDAVTRLLVLLVLCVVAQGLDIASWLLMPGDSVRESNPIVLALGPGLALAAKIGVVIFAGGVMLALRQSHPREMRMIAITCVLAGSVGTLSNLPR